MTGRLQEWQPLRLKMARHILECDGYCSLKQASCQTSQTSFQLEYLASLQLAGLAQRLLQSLPDLVLVMPLLHLRMVYCILECGCYIDQMRKGCQMSQMPDRLQGNSASLQ